MVHVFLPSSWRFTSLFSPPANDVHFRHGTNNDRSVTTAIYEPLSPLHPMFYQGTTNIVVLRFRRVFLISLTLLLVTTVILPPLSDRTCSSSQRPLLPFVVTNNCCSSDRKGFKSHASKQTNKRSNKQAMVPQSL